MKDERQAIKEAADKLGEHLKSEKGNQLKALTDKTLKNGISIKLLSGITDEKEESIYGQAYLLYNTGRYRDAIEIFRVLIMLNSTEPKYMMGLAACFHMLKGYENAISTYTLVSFLDPENPVPYFHASDCAIQMNDKLAACVSLQMAINKAENKPEFKTLKERAEITLEGLKKDLKENPIL